MSLYGTIPVRLVELGRSSMLLELIWELRGNGLGDRATAHVQGKPDVKMRSQRDTRQMQSQQLFICCDEAEKREELNLCTVQANLSLRSRARSCSVKK